MLPLKPISAHSTVIAFSFSCSRLRIVGSLAPVRCLRRNNNSVEIVHGSTLLSWSVPVPTGATMDGNNALGLELKPAKARTEVILVKSASKPVSAECRTSPKRITLK